MDQTHSISKATEKNIPDLLKLVNSAYRGETSRAGWTTEADLLDGIRTDESSLLDMLHHQDATILVCTDAASKIIGCVYLELIGMSLYLGMLSVTPGMQAKGIGKQLLKAAEVFARKKGCTTIQMTVISVRDELIAWYEKHGYSKTGETEPFPNDKKFGIPKQRLEFIVMKKNL